jgi:hypothetical protein
MTTIRRVFLIIFLIFAVRLEAKVVTIVVNYTHEAEMNEFSQISWTKLPNPGSAVCVIDTEKNQALWKFPEGEVLNDDVEISYAEGLSIVISSSLSTDVFNLKTKEYISSHLLPWNRGTKLRLSRGIFFIPKD